MSTTPTVFIIAGEPSGDVLGGRLMAALSQMTGGAIRFAGIGGESMHAQGLDTLVPMDELSVMGLAEIVPHLPRLLRHIRRAAAAVDDVAPDALITIDSPDFTRRVARRVRNRSIPRIHYVAPTVWAWRPGRAKGFAQDFTHLLALLPFEPPLFEQAGLPCTFTGHPVVEAGARSGDGTGFRARHGVPADAPTICVLPGSRRGEVARLADDFGATLELCHRRMSAMRVVIPTVPGVADMVERRAAGWPGSPLVIHGEAARYDAMAASNVALAASGTVALELAVAGVPAVIAYRVAPLTHFLLRRMVTVQYANLINIIENREIVPELIQDDCRPDRLAQEIERLLGPAGEAQLEASQPALRQLGVGGEPPSRRAARTILDIIGAAAS
ncbi:MAG: lipid-A-disaccharide synthase [Rhodospirillales bacterium]|nr:MAG: lipid-A-disaccharide synthase [Rhodospirillales bacterium]